MPEDKKPAVTDSRFAGFNKEVEESHAAAAAAAAPPAPPAKPESEVEKVVREPIVILENLLTEIVAHLGNQPRHVELLKELAVTPAK